MTGHPFISLGVFLWILRNFWEHLFYWTPLGDCFWNYFHILKYSLSVFSSLSVTTTDTAWKLSKYRVFSGPYFPVFGLNTETYGLNLHIQSEYRKIRIRKNSVYGHFSCSVRTGLIANENMERTSQVPVKIKIKGPSD